jgi:hypothetical protein
VQKVRVQYHTGCTTCCRMDPGISGTAVPQSTLIERQWLRLQTTSLPHWRRGTRTRRKKKTRDEPIERGEGVPRNSFR